MHRFLSLVRISWSTLGVGQAIEGSSPVWIAAGPALSVLGVVFFQWLWTSAQLDFCANEDAYQPQEKVNSFTVQLVYGMRNFFSFFSRKTVL